MRLDSISYNIKEQELQSLALANQKESLLKKGDPFAKATISSELDRLTELYRNNGYLRFGRDLLQGLWDTVDVSLLNPNLDPFDQIDMLEKLKEQRNNPTVGALSIVSNHYGLWYQSTNSLDPTQFTTINSWSG